MRKMASERGMSIEDFYREISGNPALERSVDEQSEKLMQENDKLIVEGRVAPFQKTNFKPINILLKVSPDEGARRQSTRIENVGRTISDIEKLTKERVQNERMHYKELYDIDDHFDEKKFDIVLDTTHTTFDEAFKIVLDKLRALGV